MEWTSNDLRKDLDKLKSLYKLEKDINRKEEILRAINSTMLNICDLELQEKSEELIPDPMILFSSVPKYTMYYPYLYEFHNKMIDSGYDVQSYVDIESSKEEINRYEIKPLINGFYESLGRKIYDKYQEVNRDNALYINIDNDIDAGNAIEYYVPILNKRYVLLGGFGDNRDIVNTLTHEYGHSIASVINPNRYYKEDFFTEIESMFFEMIGADYYYKETNDEWYMLHLKNKVNNYFIDASDVLAMKRVSDKTFKNMNDQESSFNLCYKYLRRENFNDLFIPIDVDDRMKYTFGYMIAIELFETYKEDKDLAFTLLENIVNRKKNESEYSTIMSNVTPNKSLKKHLDRVMRY